MILAVSCIAIPNYGQMIMEKPRRVKFQNSYKSRINDHITFYWKVKTYKT